MSRGIIYVLSNPSFKENYLKIGITTEIERRVKELYSSGVPTPFECEFAYEIDDYEAVERAMHKLLDDHRVNPTREFFEIDVENIKSIFSHFKGAVLVTSKVEKIIEDSSTAEEKEAAAKARGENFNFIKAGIPQNAEITFINNSDIKATVEGERKVKYEGETYYLTGLTKKLLETDASLSGFNYWSYNGKSLREIYDEYAHNRIQE